MWMSMCRYSWGCTGGGGMGTRHWDLRKLDMQEENAEQSAGWIKWSQHLFWDIDLATLDMEKHAAYIVERVLDNGRMDDWLFIKQYYGMERLKEIAQDIRSMSPKALSFISTVTAVPEDQFRCYGQIHSTNIHWSW